MRASIAHSCSPASRAISPVAQDASANSTSASPRHRLSASRSSFAARNGSVGPVLRDGPHHALEPPRVDLVRVDREEVAAGAGEQDVAADGLADVVHVGLQRVRGRRRRIALPEIVDESFRRHQGLGLEEQEREQAPRLGPLQRPGSFAVDSSGPRMPNSTASLPARSLTRLTVGRGNGLRGRSVRARSGREHGRHVAISSFSSGAQGGCVCIDADGDPGRTDCKGRAGLTVDTPGSELMDDSATSAQARGFCFSTSTLAVRGSSTMMRPATSPSAALKPPPPRPGEQLSIRTRYRNRPSSLWTRPRSRCSVATRLPPLRSLRAPAGPDSVEVRDGCEGRWDG